MAIWRVSEWFRRMEELRQAGVPDVLRREEFCVCTVGEPGECPVHDDLHEEP